MQRDRLDRGDLLGWQRYHRFPALANLYSFQPAADADRWAAYQCSPRTEPYPNVKHMSHDDDTLLRALLDQKSSPKVSRARSTYQRREDTKSFIWATCGIAIVAILGFFGLRDRIGYERVNVLLTAEGRLTDGNIQEIPQRPTTRGRGPHTTTVAVQYTADEINDYKRSYRRSYRIERSTYDFIVQQNNGRFPAILLIQYLPSQPEVSRPIMKDRDGKFIDLRFQSFGNALLSIYFCGFVLFGGWFVMVGIKLCQNDYHKDQGIRHKNDAIRLRFGCLIWISLLVLILLASIWPIDDRDFISQCWQQHTDSAWSTC
jgi:hypothetical protein